MKHTFTLLLLAGAFNASGQWLADSLIAHFPMDDSPNDTVGGLAPNLTLGAPSFCADRNGNPASAACFDGNDFWRYGDVLDMDTSMFSIAFWCRVDSLTPGVTHHDYPLAKGTTAFGNPSYSGYAFGFRDELPDTLNAACFWGQGGQPMVGQDHPFSYGTWMHLVMRRCADDIVSFHLNGTEVATDTLAVDADLTTNIYFGIGAADRYPSIRPVKGYFRGAIDDVRFYKGRCLSQDEIEVLADITVGQDDRNATSAALGLHPNPANSTLRIEVPAKSTITGPLTVLNAFGQVVSLYASSMVLDQDRIRSITMDVSAMSAGAYFVVVPTEKGSLYGRFIKE